MCFFFSVKSLQEAKDYVCFAIACTAYYAANYALCASYEISPSKIPFVGKTSKESKMMSNFRRTN